MALEIVIIIGHVGQAFLWNSLHKFNEKHLQASVLAPDPSCAQEVSDCHRSSTFKSKPLSFPLCLSKGETQQNVQVETRTFTISLLFHSLSLLDSSIREHVFFFSFFLFFKYLLNLHPPSVFNYEPCQYFRIMSIWPYYLNSLRYHITWTRQHSFFASADPTYFHNQFFLQNNWLKWNQLPFREWGRPNLQKTWIYHWNFQKW